MQLTKEQILSVTFGYATVEATEGGLRFCKCTSKQVQAQRAAAEGRGNNADKATGVRLDFHTDSAFLELDITRQGRFDILIDGLFYHQYPIEREEDVLHLDLPQGQKRVTVLLPFREHNPILRGVALCDGATLAPHLYSTKMLFIGDSITQGSNAEHDCMTYTWQTASYFNADCLINGVGSADYRKETFDVPDFDPDTVIVAYGTNDWVHYTDKSEFLDHVTCFLDHLLEAYPGKRIVGISPIWQKYVYRDDRPIGTFQEHRATIIAEFEKRGILHADGWLMIPHHEDFFADALHPNDRGFSVYARNLIKFLENH